jgi:glycosyltransferase involved in cell wall biosynthesis
MMHVPAEVYMTPAAGQLHDRDEFLDPGRSAPLDLTVMVSCYNEQDYIIATLESLTSALAEVGIGKYEIIVVDDTSKDRSCELVRNYITAHPEQRILLRQNKANRGLAQNYFDTAFLGKGKYYRLLCGDDAEPRDTMVAVFRELGKADILIPYYVTTEGKSVYRRFLSNAFSKLVNLISGHRLHYYNGLAVHLRHNVMRWHPTTRGFGFQADIICMLLDQGFSYKEIPVRTVERKGAADSRALTFKNQLSVTHTLVELFFRRISHRIYKRAPAGTTDNR